MAYQVKVLEKLNEESEVDIHKPQIIGLVLESKLDELRNEIIRKIDKELMDSQNARDFVSQKYDELCNKIQFLTELDATVTGFRSDVMSIEKRITELSSRIDNIEKKIISRDCSANGSALF